VFSLEEQKTLLKEQSTLITYVCIEKKYLSKILEIFSRQKLPELINEIDPRAGVNVVITNFGNFRRKKAFS
jgi:hypothetical protein